MKLPENFNRPYLARNVLDFWTRWHITLGLWIRDYLFMPMYKPVVERWPKRAPSLAWIFYFLAFLVAGAWHGGTVNFLIYGALQGLGASATKIYENAIVAARGRKGLKEYMKSPGIRFAAIVAESSLSMFYAPVLLPGELRRCVATAARTRGGNHGLQGLSRSRKRKKDALPCNFITWPI